MIGQENFVILFEVEIVGHDIHGGGCIFNKDEVLRRCPYKRTECLPCHMKCRFEFTNEEIHRLVIETVLPSAFCLPNLCRCRSKRTMVEIGRATGKPPVRSKSA